MMRRRRRRKKPRVPARRIERKMAIWNRHRNPVGFKFYGTYKPKRDKETKHFEFSVIVERGMRRRLMYFWVRETVRKMKKGKKLPPRRYYHAYDGFWYLHSLDWEKVDRVVAYNVRHTLT